MFNTKSYLEQFVKYGVEAADKYRKKNVPKKVYKFVPLFDSGNPSVNKRNLETLAEKNIWASKYYTLNDPYEFNAIYLDEQKIIQSGNEIDTFKNYWKAIMNSFIVASFCAEKDIHPLNNMPMWAYYANNHHGMCIEYEVKNPICLYPVFYENEMAAATSIVGNFSVLALDALAGKISPDNPELQKYQFLVLNLLCMKHKSWKQENEFRILYPNPKLKEDGARINVQNMGLQISAIYAGKNCSKRNVNKLLVVSDKVDADLYQMKMKSRSLIYDMDYELVK